MLRRRRRRRAPGLARRAARRRRRAPGATTRSAARSARASRTSACRAPAGARALPITSLDLGAGGPRRRRAWGANMAIRRAALERVGAFDAGARRCTATRRSGRRGCAPPAGGSATSRRPALDHRRAGADARLRALCARAPARAARNSRRFDGSAARRRRLRAELRVLAGCLGHGAARRVRERPRAWPPTPPGAAAGGAAAARRRPPRAGAEDFLSGRERHGRRPARRCSPRRRPRAGPRGALRTRRAPAPRRTRRRGAAARRVLVARRRPPRARRRMAARPRRAARAPATTSSSHVDRGEPGAGKFENLNALLAEQPAAGYDWLLVIDDDVVLPPRLPRPLPAPRRALRPAARPARAPPATPTPPGGHPAPPRRGAARETALRRDRPGDRVRTPRPSTRCCPFPALRMGWGLDVHWARARARARLALGIVDAAPVRHTPRPAATPTRARPRSPRRAAFLADRPYVRRDEARARS